MDKDLLISSHSFARCEPNRLLISALPGVFLPPVWRRIRSWFRGDPGTRWLGGPFWVMTTPEGPGWPRWKRICVDAISWIVFLVLISREHYLVRLWQVIDWEEINRICAPAYKNEKHGQRAWAPAQMVALLVLYFVEAFRSECDLIHQVAITPLYRWFCGFGLFSRVPDSSTLYTFRARIKAWGFERILALTVRQCLERGLVEGKLAFFDMSAVECSAHDWSPFERAVLSSHTLLRYFDELSEADCLAVLPEEARRQLVAETAVEVLGNKRLNKDRSRSVRSVLRSLDRWREKRAEAPGEALWEGAIEKIVRQLLVEEVRPPPPQVRLKALQRWLKGLARTVKERLPHARGDLDARTGHANRSTMLCGYLLGFVVDALHFVITAVPVVPLNTAQQTQLLPALDNHKERVGHYPEEVALDSAFDFDPVHAGLEERGIHGHISSREHGTTGGGLTSEHFTFDKRGYLLCPEGWPMYRGRHQKDGASPFTAPRMRCAECPRRGECLPRGQRPDGPRRIYLNPIAHRRWLQNRENCQTDAYKEAAARRFASEGRFGLAKRRHGATKMPYRSTEMNRIAGLMMGAVMNLRLLAGQERGEGRRGAALELAVLPQPGGVPVELAA